MKLLPTGASGLGTWLWLASLEPLAAAVGSSNYTVTAASLGAGSGSSQSSAYSSIGAFEAVDATRSGLSAAYQNSAGYIPQVLGVAGVEAHWVFYNDSVWDGHDPEANTNDDAAIASDKTPLMLGQTATFANYTSYSRGLNGIMIDLENLAGVPTLDDFQFRMGNSADVSSWVPAPTPVRLDYRPGGGIDGSDRITLIWESNNLDGTLGPHEAIVDQWLEVTLLSTWVTDLPAPETFFFGNAVGETGDRLGDARVDVADLQRLQALLSSPPRSADLGSFFDFNGDQVIDAEDLFIVQNASASSFPPLRLFAPGVRTPEMFLSVERMDQHHLRVTASSDRPARLQFKRDLLNPQWEEVQQLSQQISATRVQWEIALDENAPQGFFRIVPAGP